MSLSAKHKAYVKRVKAEGKTPMSFAVWAERNDRLTVARQARAESQTPKRRRNVQSAQAIVERVKVRRAEKPRQIVVKHPQEQASGRQLWKLMELGCIEFISKGEASQMIEKALNGR